MTAEVTPARSPTGDSASRPDPVVEAAEGLLRSDGPHALSLRRIAELAGTSTQAVYTRFGGKAGLVDALYREGYRRLARRLDEVDDRLEPAERIRRLSAAYRANAIENPHLYEVMTGRPVPEYAAPLESRQRARRTLQAAIDAIADAVDAGHLEGEPEEIAQRMWAAGHGFVSLEIHGLDAGTDGSARYEELIDVLLAGHAASTEPG